MDNLCAGDTDQAMAYILRVLRRDFKGSTLCKFTRGEELVLATLSLLRQLDIGKDKYSDLKFWVESLFEITLPSWQTLREERLRCCPPVKEDGEQGHSSTLQAVLDITVDRMAERPDIQPLLKDKQQLVLVVGTGNDSVSGLGVDARKTTVNTDFLCNTAAQILELRDRDTGKKLWVNPVPGSATYVRPIAHTRLKDSEDAMQTWVKDHEAEIKNLTTHTLNVNDGKVSVSYVVFPALLDGKMRKAVYTAALAEATSQGYRFKTCYGSATKMDYNTCWVG